MIIIIDYECGNLGSIKNMLYQIGVGAEITNDKGVIAQASKIILPGVGSFDYGITKLEELDIRKTLEARKHAGIPILGICLGAQLMCNQSEEGKLKGLSWVNASVYRFPNELNNIRYPVPHIGWDLVRPIKKSKIFDRMPEDSRFYFVHSYYIACHEPPDALAVNHYSSEFHSAFTHENILGVQFHPEKSHQFGKQLLRNFVEFY